FVAGSVDWNEKDAGMVVASPMVMPAAVALVGLMMVTKAVAGSPTITDRLVGSTAATGATGAASRACARKKSQRSRVALMSNVLAPTSRSGSFQPPGQVWPPPLTV